MSESLSSIVKSGGDFITRFAGGGTISSGNTGTLVTLTPPAGQRVRLTHLSTTEGVEQAGISVLIGSETIIDKLDLNGARPLNATKFSVGSYQPYPISTPPVTNYHQFTGKVGEALVILKNAGNTVPILYYGYEFGL